MKWLPYCCPIGGENGPKPGLNSIGYTGGVCGNAPSVNAGIEGVIGGKRPCIGESGPANGYGGGIVIRPGGSPCDLGDGVSCPAAAGFGAGTIPLTGVAER